MTWKLTAFGKTRSPLTGVPWRDLSDEEFVAAEALFPEGVLRDRGYFEKAERGATTAEPRGFVPSGGPEPAPVPSPDSIEDQSAPRRRARGRSADAPADATNEDEAVADDELSSEASDD